MIRSNFSTSGLHVGENDVNMTYAYGLGDFFSIMFEDTSIPNLLLEADTLTASEAYSRFLQLTSGMSLEDIQVTVGSQIQLVLVNSADLIAGTPSTYRLTEKLTSARYVANRPLLPTELLESKVDFDIYQDEEGVSCIRFARLLQEGPLGADGGYAFSSRLLSDGTTQYALWFVDAHIDERMVSSCFGNLIGVTERNSSEEFANFVYGLYYVYTQGPTLTVLRRGLNLVIGIPLARLQETVIDIRMYLQTDQYIVVTDQNQYIIPYGLPPSVAIGDVLEVGQELAQWVEVKDYTNDGDWWINLYIPSTVVPEPPSGEPSRYAVSGGQMDYLMRTYLKTHTFLVRVNVTTFKNIQTFTELFSIIRKSKPAYAQPVYVWAVANDEVVSVADDSALVGINSLEDDDLGQAYDHMVRSASQPLSRGRARFIRFNGPEYARSLVGESVKLNISNNNVQTMPVSGYSNPQAVTRGNSWEELDWLNILTTRSSDTWRGRRDQVGYRRGHLLSDVAPERIGPFTPTYQEGEPLLQTAALSSVFKDLPENSRVVPLTVMSVEELDLKLEAFGLSRQGTARFLLPLHQLSKAINAHRILYPVLEQVTPGEGEDAFPVPSAFDFAKYFGIRSYSIAHEDPVQAYLTNPPQSMNKDMCKSMLYQGGESLSHAAEGDQLLFTFINCSLVAVYLVSSDAYSDMPSFLPVDSVLETPTASARGLASRGMALHDSPFYLRRGSVSLVNNTPPEAVEDPSTELANFLYSESISESARVVPVTFMSRTEAEDKAAYWDDPPPSPGVKYDLLSHPYPYRVAAEVNLRKVGMFINISPSSCALFQDAAGVLPVTAMEQPVGRAEELYWADEAVIQVNPERRPVVRARYNLLTYTRFEGTVVGQGPNDVGTPPNGWSVASALAGSYISQYSNNTIRLEASNSSVVLQRGVTINPYSLYTFRIVVTMNPQSLTVRQLVNVLGVSASYKVSGDTINEAAYIPEAGTELYAVVQNDSATTYAAYLQIGVGVYSASTGSAAFKEPDFRYSTGMDWLSSYQRVGDPVPGTSLVPGNPDYDTDGFPPYLSFNGVDQYLYSAEDRTFTSDKITASAIFNRRGGTATGPVFHFSTAEGDFSLSLQSTGSARMSYEAASMTGLLQVRFDEPELVVCQPYTAIVDTSQPLATQQMAVYANKVTPSTTLTSSDTLDPYVITSGRIVIGANRSLTSFFQGDFYGLSVSGGALPVSSRESVEDWLLQEAAKTRTVLNPTLYHYPDFFRRDGARPALPLVPRGNFYESTPLPTDVDMDYGNDRILLYWVALNTVGVFWICNNPAVFLQDYWTISYDGVPALTRVDSGTPANQGFVLVDPYGEPPSLNYDYLAQSVNARALNSAVLPADPVFVYSDDLNPTVVVTRGGIVLSQTLSL